MWKILAIVAALGFVQINAQVEFCVQCESTISDFGCVDPEFLDRFIQACPTANSTGSCFTQVTPDGFTRRGCGAQVNRTECDGEFCTVCQLASGASSPCNTAVLPIDRLTCYECSGDFNSTCNNLNGTDLRPIICPVFRSDDRCYGTRAGDIVTRGCQSNAPAGRCDGNRCTICTGHGCNNIIGPELNSAFGLQVASKSLLLAAIAAVFLRFYHN